MDATRTEANDEPADRALAEVLPQLRALRLRGWGLVGLTVAAAAAVLAVNGWLGSPILGGAVVFGIAGWVRGAQERIVLPIVARVFGLTHAKGKVDYFEAMPTVFIPRGSRRQIDDMLSGQVAGRAFRFAEVRTTTGGKNRRTLFRGLVMDVPCRAGMPAFVIADEKQTKGFLFFQGNVPVEGMIHLLQARGRMGETYGLWARDRGAQERAGMQAFMDRMVAVGAEVLGTASLYSLACTGREYFVALSHTEDLFRVGGLLAGEAQVMADIRRAAGEVAHPVNLVSGILRAEEALLSAQRA